MRLGETIIPLTCRNKGAQKPLVRSVLTDEVKSGREKHAAIVKTLSAAADGRPL